MKPSIAAVLGFMCLALTANAAEPAPSPTPDPDDVEITVRPIQRPAPEVPGATPEATKKIDEITVLGLKDDLVRDFVKSYAAPVSSVGQIARWRSPICPTVLGLVDYQGALVANRVRSAAARIGAPVVISKPGDDKAPSKTEKPCKPNVWIVFSSKAQDIMDQIRRKSPWLLGFHYYAQAKKLATITNTAQSWYATETVDARGMTQPDSTDEDAISSTGEMRTTAWLGGRLKTGTRSQFADALIVVDFNKIKGVPLPSIADYVAMLALAQTKTFDVCRGVPSITNLFAQGCDAANKTRQLSETDIAYLRALYQMDSEANLALQQIELARGMARNLAGK